LFDPTAPEAKYTHWKQTVFYLDEAILADKGSMIRGFFECRPNTNNKRDLDFQIQIDYKGTNDERKEEIFQYKMR
jgi:protein arginine N-methyltransferase 1